MKKDNVKSGRAPMSTGQQGNDLSERAGIGGTYETGLTVSAK